MKDPRNSTLRGRTSSVPRKHRSPLAEFRSIPDNTSKQNIANALSDPTPTTTQSPRQINMKFAATIAAALFGVAALAAPATTWEAQWSRNSRPRRPTPADPRAKSFGLTGSVIQFRGLLGGSSCGSRSRTA
ncbi:hypothetical protein EJ03DRAFT_61395 [Teratosphaeria nubilosa]|uniref:Uncharacterized protein n=1 Tax=Teratosphaeria nubilosa TaxID=161662 RepID=A0A6G1LCR3_9PEZI|nr:hypothetical protein EJ03DRAFT_61395 [Teratosphaeria nubilosa]